MNKYNHPPFLVKHIYNTPPTLYILDETYQPSIDEMLFISALDLAYAKRERELELQLTIEKLLAILADEQINLHTYDIIDLGTIQAPSAVSSPMNAPITTSTAYSTETITSSSRPKMNTSSPKPAYKRLPRIIPALRNISALSPTPTALLTSQTYSTNKQHIFRIITPIYIFLLIFYHLLWYNILKQ